MNRIDVHGGGQRRELVADRLRNARLRLHMSRRRQRGEQPLLELPLLELPLLEDEKVGTAPLEAHEPPGARD